MFPDAIPGHVGRRIWVFENHAPQRVEIIAIQLRIAEGLGPLFDEGVEIDILLEIEKVLAVFLVEAEELPAHRAQQLLQHRLDERTQEAGILFGNRQHQAEIVSQLLRCRSDRRVMSDVVRRWTDSACTIRIAAGLYCGRVKACWTRASRTPLRSMTSLMAGSDRNDGLSRSTLQ